MLGFVAQGYADGKKKNRKKKNCLKEKWRLNAFFIEILENF